jgi:hypothetical protein
MSSRDPAYTWSLRALIARHRRISLAVFAVLAVMVVMFVIEVAGSGAITIRDSSTCAAWSVAGRAAQSAYARQYVSEHGWLGRGGASAGSVRAAVNAGCVAAFDYDEADTVTVLDALEHRY